MLGTPSERMTVTSMKARILITAIGLSTVPLFAFAAGDLIAEQPDFSTRVAHNESATYNTITPVGLGEVTSITFSGDFTMATSGMQWAFSWNQDGWIRYYSVNGVDLFSPVGAHAGTNGMVTVDVTCVYATFASMAHPDDLTQIHCPIETFVAGSFAIVNASSSVTYYDGTPTGIPYLRLNGSASGQTNTRIVSISPPTNSTIATSTEAQVGGQVYIADADYVDGMFFEQKYAIFSSSQSSVACVDCLFTTIETPITHAGYTTISASTSLLQIGRYTLISSIRVESSLVGQFVQWLGFGQFGSSLSVGTTTNFTVVQNNGFDTFVASTTAAINAYVASSTFSMASCSSWTSFNLGDCLGILFYPQAEPIAVALTEFRDGFLSIWPLGFITRLETIMWTAQDVPIPDIEIDLPNGTPAAGLSVSLPVTGALMSTGSLVGDTVSPNTGLTLQESIGDDWHYYIYFLFFLGMAWEVLGLFRGNHHR